MQASLILNVFEASGLEVFDCFKGPILLSILGIVESHKPWTLLDCSQNQPKCTSPTSNLAYGAAASKKIYTHHLQQLKKIGVRTKHLEAQVQTLLNMTRTLQYFLQSKPNVMIHTLQSE